MPREASHRRWPRLAGLALGLALLIAYVAAMRPALERRRVRRTIARYKADPSQETAQALADLLDRQQVPQALGNEVLELLVTPDVAVRSAYPARRLIQVAVSHPFPVRFPNASLVVARHVYGGKLGVLHSASGGGGNTLDTTPQLVAMNRPDWGPKPGEPGDYHHSVRYECTLRSGASGGPSDEERPILYECSVEIPVTIRIVEPHQAEVIQRRSSESLDKAMRAAFAIANDTPGIRMPLESGEMYEVQGRYAMRYAALPENVGFRYIYRDQGGYTDEIDGRTLRARAGGPRQTAHFPVEELLLPPGRYQGTALLIPDEAAAYPDAAIKTIWGGTIELPIEFIVRVTEKVPEERSEDAK